MIAVVCPIPVRSSISPLFCFKLVHLIRYSMHSNKYILFYSIDSIQKGITVNNPAWRGAGEVTKKPAGTELGRTSQPETSPPKSPFLDFLRND